ncbi:hypothetical protein QBC46DRAFT_399723 [Diplogelasinospora grovesii]|uniref:C2H2-type domain-containing protein n=1 Tax=Diplogelasinospora grovesii TaxID=303347 RepID=A0AAN6RZ21_9PEZI|nr:hypothetical protein QBC46DRAFT_399723 [Diplogelasinospora grovesii]
MSTTILCGFKVSVAVLDAFLTANGLDETEGRPQYYPDHPDKDKISALLYKKIVSKAEAAAAGGSGSGSTASIDKNKFRVMMPSTEGMQHSFVAYVTYAWFTVYAHRELRVDEDLPAEIPTGFEELRKEILSFADPSRGVPESEKIGDEEGHMGLFVVYTYGYKGEYAPPWAYERNGPFKCDQCDAVFTGMMPWDRRQEHRIEVHGVKESRNPFPEG